MRPLPHKALAFSLFLALIALTSCDKKEASSSPSKQEDASETSQNPISPSAIAPLISFAQNSADKLESASVTLDASIQAFLANPNQESLEQTQASWRALILTQREWLLIKHLSMVDPQRFEVINTLDYRIASFPVQPGFLDKFGEYPYSGLVHDISFPLTLESLANQHGLTDPTEVVLGSYAIAFMLFDVGQDRAVEDFFPVDTLTEELKAQGFEKTEEIPNNRRRRMLALQSQSLVLDVKALARYTKPNNEDTLANSFSGLSENQMSFMMARALEGAITQMLIEIGEINQAPETFLALPPQVASSAFDFQQQYISAGISSLQNGLSFVDSESAKSIASLFEKAKAATLKENSGEDTKKNYWREAFATLKGAVDMLSMQKALIRSGSKN